MAIRRVLKLSPRFYGPYKVLQKIGKVPYELEFSKTHPVFLVSQLKKKLSQRENSQTKLPPIIEEGIVQAALEKILDRCLVKKGGQALAEVLLQWQGAREEDSTWEDHHQLRERFLDLNLEGKVVLRGGSVEDARS